MSRKKNGDKASNFGNEIQCAYCQRPIQSEYLGFAQNQGLDDNTTGNLVYICPECNNSNKDLIREIDFLNYIEALLEQNVEFSETKRDVLIGNNTKWRIDIFTKDRGTELFLEISAYTFLDAPRIYDLVNELTIYQKEIHNSNLAIAVLCVVSEDTKRYFAQKQIAVWDIDYISKRFGKEIIKLKHPIFTKLFIANLDKKPEIKLVKKLELIKPGRAEWSLYQKLMNEILTTLFCPPLDNPHYEITDDFKINRRDFIIPNYCESGFWAYMRDQYSADFIIIDAKNYSKKVQKRDVLQVSNYLKKHGAGLFGIIISRTEQDLSASLTIREVWAIQRKLIIVLNDEDIKQMLTIKAVNGACEDVLKSKIERFRLSL